MGSEKTILKLKKALKKKAKTNIKKIAKNRMIFLFIC
jgi:hypothetical protein